MSESAPSTASRILTAVPGSGAIRAAAPIAMQRVTGRFEVDSWGRDGDMVRMASPIAALRWRVNLFGEHHLPQRSGALVVANARRFGLVPVMVAWALGEALHRPVRFVGRPDWAPVGDVMRRLGGLLDDRRDLEGALRDGQIVVIGTTPQRGLDRVGAVPHHLIGAALDAHVRVHTALAVSQPLGRSARIEIGTVVRPRRVRRGPLAEVELADLVHDRLVIHRNAVLPGWGKSS